MVSISDVTNDGTNIIISGHLGEHRPFHSCHNTNRSTDEIPITKCRLWSWNRRHTRTKRRGSGSLSESRMTHLVGGGASPASCTRCTGEGDAHKHTTCTGKTCKLASRWLRFKSATPPFPENPNYKSSGTFHTMYTPKMDFSVGGWRLCIRNQSSAGRTHTKLKQNKVGFLLPLPWVCRLHPMTS